MSKRKTNNGGGLTIDDRTSAIKDFVPSTMEDLKEYERLGREADEAKRSRRATRKSAVEAEATTDEEATVDATTTETTEGEDVMSDTKKKAPAKKAASKKAPAKKAPAKKAPAKKAEGKKVTGVTAGRRKAGSTRGIGALAIELLQRKPAMENDAIIKAVLSQYPDSKINERHLAWYRNKIKRDAEA